MPGPNSAPNGDARLTLAQPMLCQVHGEHTARCDEGCTRVRLREYLLRRNRLATGKTRATRGR